MRYTIIFLSVLLLNTLSYCQYSPSPDSIRKHVYYLASDKLEGRKAGNDGDSLAAIYIRDQFKKAGLSSPYESGFQYFSLVTDVKAGNKNHFSINGNTYTVTKDFQPFSFSSSDSVSGSVVFAGFGIVGESQDLKWDDYKNIEVKNKWALVLRGDPEPDNASSALIPLSSDRAKALTAKDKGAKGILLVSPSSIDKSDNTIDMSFDKSVSDAGIPVISITRSLAAQIIGRPVTSIDSVEKVMLRDKHPVTFETSNRVHAVTDIVRTKSSSRNVVYIIKGSDKNLSSEYIVIGAHYDHLGLGGHGSGSRVPDESDVHYGADDNASGVASIIELARYFSRLKTAPPRSIVFVAFGAEEMGIIGAKHFIENCPIPVKSIKGMINLDMVGRLNSSEPVVNISGVGTYTVADSIFNVLDKDSKFKVKRIPDGYGPSDHAAFYTSGIPVNFITTGAHSDYHTPQDTPDKINYTGLYEIIIYTSKLASILSTIQNPPIFTESGPIRQAGHYNRNLKVTLGIMPDVSGEETSGGMKVEGTRKGAPAERAGMQKGDVITAINGLKVSNIYDYMNRMATLKPGETVNVEILRDNKVEILIIQL